MSMQTFPDQYLSFDDFEAYKVQATGVKTWTQRAYHKAYLDLAPRIDAPAIKEILRPLIPDATRDRSKKIREGPSATPKFKRYERLVAAIVIFVNIEKWQTMTASDISKTLQKFLARRITTLNRLITEASIWMKPQLFDLPQKPKEKIEEVVAVQEERHQSPQRRVAEVDPRLKDVIEEAMKLEVDDRVPGQLKENLDPMILVFDQVRTRVTELNLELEEKRKRLMQLRGKAKAEADEQARMKEEKLAIENAFEQNRQKLAKPMRRKA